MPREQLRVRQSWFWTCARRTGSSKPYVLPFSLVSWMHQAWLTQQSTSASWQQPPAAMRTTCTACCATWHNFFEELPGQIFKLTSMGQHLRADHPSGLCYAASSFGAAGHFVPWMHLDRAVKEGKVAFDFFRPDLPGGIFQYMTLPENKAEEEGFNRLMTTFTKTMDVGIVQLHDFSGYSVVADIGGGYGRLLMDILDTHPGVQQGIVFELAEVVDMAPEVPDRFRGKLSWVKGDFWKAIDVKADCYVMKSILHDWSDERCVTILSHLRASMPPGAVLVNFDRLMPDFGTPGFHPAKGMDINMMAMVGGKERTSQQWHDLLGQAGFSIRSISQAPGMAAIFAVPSPPN